MKMQGKLVDAVTGEPLDQVVLELVDSEGKPIDINGEITNEKGEFLIEDALFDDEDSPVFIKIELNGYQTTILSPSQLNGLVKIVPLKGYVKTSAGNLARRSLTNSSYTIPIILASAGIVTMILYFALPNK